MSDEDAILLVLNAIPGKKFVSVCGCAIKFEVKETADKRFLKLIQDRSKPIDVSIYRHLDDTYLDDKGNVKPWIVVYGIQIDGNRLNPIPGEIMKRRRRKMDGVVFDTIDLNALLVNMLTNAASDGIGEAGADAYKAAIKAGGDSTDGCEAAINAAAEAAIRKIKQ